MHILIVGMPDSIHVARWIGQVQRAGLEVTLFPVYLARPHRDLGRNVRYPSWSSIFFYADKILEKVLKRAFTRFCEQALSLAIRIYQPDILHSLEFQHSAYLTLPVIEKLRRQMHNPPRWIVTNWGSDVYLFGR
ncbi:MAG: hypothetical protein C0410_14165, partial [Anaerolinea sp.]|nr:hypothetical protein [Anaerolinea sp.]